jgi:hypothetical protein
MQNHWSKYSTLAAVLSLTAVGLFCGLSTIGFAWRILHVVGFKPNLWAMIEALSTAVTAAAVLGGGFVAYRQLNEGASSRHMEVADRLFMELNSDENIDARRWIFRNLPDDPKEGIPALNDQGRAAIKRTLNSLDRVAFLTQSGWIPQEMVMPWMSPMVVKAWVKLCPYVEYESERRGEPDYYEHACALAQQCQEWRTENVPEAEVRWLEDAL